MKILQRLRNRSSRGDAGDPGSAERSSPGSNELAIPGYDHLDHKQVGAQDLMSTVRQPLKRECRSTQEEIVDTVEGQLAPGPEPADGDSPRETSTAGCDSVEPVDAAAAPGW